MLCGLTNNAIEKQQQDRAVKEEELYLDSVSDFN